MSGRDGSVQILDRETLDAVVLRSLELTFSAFVRSIRAGEMRVVPAGDTPSGIGIVRIGDRRYKLAEKNPGSLNGRLQNEECALDATEKLGEISERLLADRRRIVEENQALRTLLSPLEESVAFVTAINSQTGDLESAHTFKRVQ
jgi:hypothetical protein